jgi:hypothetical protein
MELPAPQTDAAVEALETDGVAVLGGLVTPAQLRAMQDAFARVLGQMRWNTSRGFEKTDNHRRMVEDILTLDPAFQALALHPQVKRVLDQYLGTSYVLSEVRGWETIRTRADFHGWHNDAWYDPALPVPPREVKLGLYLTDVKSGHFSYIKGTHVGQRHRHWNDREIAHLADRIVHLKGPAGTTFLFDTAGIHRQSSPVLEPRHVVFFNYHDPTVPLQAIDEVAYRYHPLILNAAFLGDLTPDDRRILGFGNHHAYRPGYDPPHRYRWLNAAFAAAFTGVLLLDRQLGIAASGWRYLRRKLRGG